MTGIRPRSSPLRGELNCRTKTENSLPQSKASFGGTESKEEGFSFDEVEATGRGAAIEPSRLGRDLVGGQSFSWTAASESSWKGVIGKSVVELRLSNDRLDLENR